MSASHGTRSHRSLVVRATRTVQSSGGGRHRLYRVSAARRMSRAIVGTISSIVTSYADGIRVVTGSYALVPFVGPVAL